MRVVDVSRIGVAAIRHRLLHRRRTVHGTDGAGELSAYDVR